MRPRLFWIVLALGLASATRQIDTNVFDARKALRFWTAIQRTNAVRVGAFGDSICDPYMGGKLAGFSPPLRDFLGAQSGGINSYSPYLYYATNGDGSFK